MVAALLADRKLTVRNAEHLLEDLFTEFLKTDIPVEVPPSVDIDIVGEDRETPSGRQHLDGWHEGKVRNRAIPCSETDHVAAACDLVYYEINIFSTGNQDS